jgi:hypothetical protein
MGEYSEVETILSGAQPPPSMTSRQRSNEEPFHTGGSAAGTEVGVANQKAAELAPVIAELRSAGITSKKGIAKALNNRAIPTPRGVGEWRAIQVARVLARLEV